MSLMPLLLATLATVAAPKPLWVELGPTNSGGGLSVPDAGDGRNVPATVGGVACRRIVGGPIAYMYVKADEARLPAGHYDAYVTVEFWDGAPAVHPVEYDASPRKGVANSHYTQAQDGIVCFGTRTWRRAVLHLPDALFAHGQNWGADFRICGSGLAVRRIEVTFTRPADYVPGGVRVPSNLPRRASPGMEVIFGAVPISYPEAALARALGAKSYETYVTWRSVENAGEGKWDWSQWDKQVEILRRAGLKWVPILIAGPAYATPDWFRKSSRSVPYVCLEHHQASEIQSLWNPNWRHWIDRFYAAFAAHYRDSAAIESILLGVSGTYGETLYPSGPPTGWTYDIPGPFHNHIGWWAGDRFAVADFRRAMTARYGDIASLNRAWGTKLASFADVAPFLPDKAPSLRARLDMVSWYIDSMTHWAAYCAGDLRKHMPETEIYVAVGGFGEPILGADFTAIARAVEPFHAGLRITNEGSDYRMNFAITREVATACRALGEVFTFEPGGDVTAAGNVARIYNDTASGAHGLFCYTTNVEQSGAASRIFDGALPWLTRREPRVPAGLFLPKTSWRLEDTGNPTTLRAAQVLRDRVDLQMVDADLLAAAPPPDLRVLAVCDAPYATPAEVAALRRWVEKGGVLLALAAPGQPLLRSDDPGKASGAADLLASPPVDARPLRVTPVGPPPRHFRLSVGQAPDQDYLFGNWHDREVGGLFPDIKGATMRWSAARAGLLLPCDPASDAVLMIDAHLDAHSFPGDNRVLVNGTVVGTFSAPGTRQYRFRVPRAVLARGEGQGGDVAEVSFDVHAFRPSDYGGGDGRELGVAVADVELWATGAESQPAVTTPLRWRLDWAATAPCLRRIGKGATLVLPGHQLAGLAEALVEVLAHPDRLVPGAKPCPAPPQPLGVYATTTSKGVLFYNSGTQAREADGVKVPAEGLSWKPAD